jgi:hypothetical protein
MTAPGVNRLRGIPSIGQSTVLKGFAPGCISVDFCTLRHQLILLPFAYFVFASLNRWSTERFHCNVVSVERAEVS